DQEPIPRHEAIPKPTEQPTGGTPMRSRRSRTRRAAAVLAAGLLVLAGCGDDDDDDASTDTGSESTDGGGGGGGRGALPDTGRVNLMSAGEPEEVSAYQESFDELINENVDYEVEIESIADFAQQFQIRAEGGTLDVAAVPQPGAIAGLAED